ncbi:MAG: 2-oxoacid:ferredoxin oxidoreductase subunit beta [Deltaproteobacteria bacterium]|nr:2-oxoacid:ferredoxin oxidoreductase subunit beta [Deltaproteobacteria bacterium]
MAAPALTRKDFASAQEVRWCPGCGDYSILAQVQKVLPDLGIPKENIVFISGIGCSSRFPYYMETYGFHSIHGRAPTLASGLKASRPELSIWVITGDGDGLSIGGNHLLHVMRRNIDLTIVLFNNQIYGLTKGQYSPTSEFGKKTKTSPLGNIDFPIRPLSVALAAEASFVARSVDADVKHMQQVLERAARHKGTSFVEVYQNCVIFNDGAFDGFATKEQRPEHTVQLVHGKPLVFGAKRDKGIRLNGFTPEVVTLGNGITESDLLVHNEALHDPTLGMLLDRMTHPDFPVPVGVFRAVERPTYEDMMTDQIQRAVERRGAGELGQLFREGDVWEVKAKDANRVP